MVGFAVTIVVITFSVWLVRTAAKRLLREQWERWYLRRTVNAFLFFTILFVFLAAYWGSETVFYLPGQLNAQFEPFRAYPLPLHVQKATEKLAFFMGAQFFLDHFFHWVILPTLVAALAARITEWLVLRRIGKAAKSSK